jgi:hypothetical protein
VHAERARNQSGARLLIADSNEPNDAPVQGRKTASGRQQ